MSVKSLLQGVAILLVLMLMLWLAFYVLIFLAVAALGFAIFLWVKRFMIAQGWLGDDAPPLGETFGGMYQSVYENARSRYDQYRSKSSDEVIEGDYTDVSEGDVSIEEPKADDNADDDSKAAS